MQGEAARTGLLHQQCIHISNFGIASKDLPSILFRGGWLDFQRFYLYLPSVVKFFLAQAGFGDFLSCLAMWADAAYLKTLIERFRPETMTFHMGMAEMTLTPVDWPMITGIRIGGQPVANLRTPSRDEVIQLIGDYPTSSNLHDSEVKMTWLSDLFGLNELVDLGQSDGDIIIEPVRAVMLACISLLKLLGKTQAGFLVLVKHYGRLGRGAPIRLGQSRIHHVDVQHSSGLHWGSEVRCWLLAPLRSLGVSALPAMPPPPL